MSESEIAKLYGELQTLNAKLDHLAEAFNRFAYADGGPRCARHSNRIKHVEESAELCHTRISGVKKWIVAALVAAAGMLINFAWDIIRSAARQ